MARVTSIFDLAEFKGLSKTWERRVRELRGRAAYYDGTVYRKLQELFGPMWPRLYRGIKPLFLPFSRSVSVDAGIIPGGWAFVEGAPEAWTQAREVVFRESAWAAKGVLWVHYGAQYGVSVLKVVDERMRGRAVLAPVDPTRVLVVGRSLYDQTAALSLYVDKRRIGGDLVEYAEVITPETVRTFVDGALTGVGGRPATYPNLLQAVPYVEVKHIDDGTEFGECTYQRAIEMLDEVNELASYLADIIKKHVEPQWAISGAEPAELEHSGDNVWFLPQGSEASALVAKIDVQGVLEFVKVIRDNVHEALPETSFTELRKRERVATATLELQMLELTLKIQRARPNYDRGLAQALRLCGVFGKQVGNATLAALDDPALAFDNERRVLPLDPEARLRIESLALTVQAQREALAMQRELNE